jgi:hypothetical protein
LSSTVDPKTLRALLKSTVELEKSILSSVVQTASDPVALKAAEKWARSARKRLDQQTKVVLDAARPTPVEPAASINVNRPAPASVPVDLVVEPSPGEEPAPDLKPVEEAEDLAAEAESVGPDAPPRGNGLFWKAGAELMRLGFGIDITPKPIRLDDGTEIRYDEPISRERALTCGLIGRERCVDSDVAHALGIDPDDGWPDPVTLREAFGRRLWQCEAYLSLCDLQDAEPPRPTTEQVLAEIARRDAANAALEIDPEPDPPAGPAARRRLASAAKQALARQERREKTRATIREHVAPAANPAPEPLVESINVNGPDPTPDPEPTPPPPTGPAPRRRRLTAEERTAERALVAQGRREKTREHVSAKLQELPGFDPAASWVLLPEAQAHSWVASALGYDQKAWDRVRSQGGRRWRDVTDTYYWSELFRSADHWRSWWRTDAPAGGPVLALVDGKLAPSKSRCKPPEDHVEPVVGEPAADPAPAPPVAVGPVVEPSPEPSPKPTPSLGLPGLEVLRADVREVVRDIPLADLFANASKIREAVRSARPRPVARATRPPGKLPAILTSPAPRARVVS